MTAQIWVWIALGISASAFAACLWQLANMRGFRARGRRRVLQTTDANHGRQRQADHRALTGNEKRLYNESQKLLQQGNIPTAARILEQLNMQREAIQALEDHGLIHEAAKILMRMQRHNRAGVVYARHAMWDNAAQCFKMANMPLEVAKCSREAGQFAVAAEYFKKVEHYEDAAICLEQTGDLQGAARLFISAGLADRAMQLYTKLAQSGSDLAKLGFQEEEIKQIVSYLGDGHTDINLADVVVSHNKLNDVLLHLLQRGLNKQAAELFLRATSDIGPMLMAEVSYQDQSAANLAEVFLAVANFQYAGAVFERMGSFDRAGHAFESAEDFERAAYCYERAGQGVKAKLLKDKAKTSAYRAPIGGPSFALANAGTEAGSPSAFGEESTAVVDVKPKGSKLPPPPSPGGIPAPAAKMESLPSSPMDVTAPTPPAIPFKVSPVEPVGDVVKLPPVPTQQTSLADTRAVFHRAKFFADLDFDQKNKLWEIGATQSYSEGASVLTYQDEPKGIYIIVQGSVSCYRMVGGKEAYVDQMSESESFGELWLLADQPTAVRFVASKETRIHIISRDAFNNLLDKDGTIARKVYKRFTLRLLKRLLKPEKQSTIQAAS